LAQALEINSAHLCFRELNDADDTDDSTDENGGIFYLEDVAFGQYVSLLAASDQKTLQV
jgi:hypothetical protein